MLGTYIKNGKSEKEINLFEYAENNLEIGLNHLYIYDYANHFFNEMVDYHFNRKLKLYETSDLSEHQAEEIAWEETIKLMNDRIGEYEPNSAYEYTFK